MKTAIAWAVIMLLLAGCNPERKPVFVTENHCTTSEERSALAKFVIDCAKAANPLSDEEGEDLVQQCQVTGEDVICPAHLHKKTFSDAAYSWRIEEVETTGDTP